MPVKTAARTYCVPQTTLRDRVAGRIDIDTVKSGTAPVLSLEEEVRLVDHVTLLAKVGYGYTITEVCNLASEYAADIGKRDREHPLTVKWYRGFANRWPNIVVKKPRSLAIARAKATSEENVTNYFNELDKILTKYNIKDKPQHIYNVDEKGISANHTPPMIVTDRKSTPVAVTSGMSYNVTVIGAGNALGTSIPAFFVFPGKRMRSELLEGSTPGVTGTVSDNGWSNGAVFKKYLQEHFVKYAQGRDKSQPILVLYDGHRSHVSVDIIDWAVSENIILFVLPAHTSHILQPLDVGCFGPFQHIYNDLRHKLMRTNSSSNIPKHAVCELGCKAYNMSLTPTNLQSSFRKSGIHPFNPAEIDRPRDMATTTTATPAGVAAQTETTTSPVAVNDECNATVIDTEIPTTTPTSPTSHITHFFNDIEDIVLDKSATTKKRNVLTAVVGGKQITETTITDKIKEHINGQPVAKKKKTETAPVNKGKKTARKGKSTPAPKKTAHVGSSQVAGPSGYVDDSDLSSVESQDGDACCVCGKWQPDELRRSAFIEFTSWGQCCVAGCEHWVHLKYCTDVRTLRRKDIFNCPCHPGLPSKCVPGE